MRKDRRRSRETPSFIYIDFDNETLCQGGLYDMTHFTGHPGGVGRLQMAAGNDLEVYWGVYTQHNRGHIMEHMKRYKIGEVTAEDMKLITENTVYDESVYAGNPEPYPGLLTNTR